MPTVPEVKTLNTDSVSILNAIRANASNTYQDRIPAATRENIREVGNSLLNYEAGMNEFLNALVNRIAFVLITSKSYQNPLRMFKKGMMEFGEAVEEVFVNIARAHPFDPVKAQDDLYKMEIPDVAAVFHKLNFRTFYKQTINNDMLRTAFLSYNGIEDLIARIVDAMYTAGNYDEFITMKQLIVDAANDGHFYPVTVPAPTADNGKEIITTIKGISNAMEFMSSKYNFMGVLNHTPKDDQFLIIDAQFAALFDVNVLASAFNMEKAEFLGHQVLIDDFGSLTGVVAVLVDRDWFMVFDNFQGFRENYNGQGLYWNYFYHLWKTFSTSPFSNAVMFTTNTPGVTSVTVTPGTVTLAKGGKPYQFNATVSGTGFAPQNVVWSVGGTDNTVSTISYNGILTVPQNETNKTLTVTATSVYDGTKSGTSTVTIN